MAEWTNAAVLKTVNPPAGFVGSNPTPSANTGILRQANRKTPKAAARGYPDLSSQPARFSLPRIEPLLDSNRAKFSASFRSNASFSAQCPFRFRA